MLGYQTNPRWRDMSDFVVHLTRPGVPCHDAYQNMLSILGSRTLVPGPEGFGIARKESTVLETQRSVCFSEIPLDQLGRLAQRRSRYGLAFSKSFLRSRGGGPVWYVHYGSSAHLAVKDLIQRALVKPEPRQEPIWAMTPFIDIKGEAPEAPYNYMFDWEREWRAPGLLRFSEYDVAMLFLPEELHTVARSFFEWAVRENQGPGYFCPLLDPEWPAERITEVMARPVPRPQLRPI